MKRIFTSIAFALCITSFVTAQETVTIKLNSDGFGGTRVITSLETNETNFSKLTVIKGTLVELSGSVAEENTANFVSATGIDEVFDKSKDEKAKSKIIYDLNGRRVENAEKNGLYIIDGKTTLVR